MSVCVYIYPGNLLFFFLPNIVFLIIFPILINAVLLYFHCCIIFHCMTLPQFVHSHINRLSFSSFSIANKATLNIFVFVPLCMYVRLF